MSLRGLRAAGTGKHDHKPGWPTRADMAISPSTTSAVADLIVFSMQGAIWKVPEPPSGLVSVIVLEVPVVAFESVDTSNVTVVAVEATARTV